MSQLVNNYLILLFLWRCHITFEHMKQLAQNTFRDNDFLAQSAQTGCIFLRYLALLLAVSTDHIVKFNEKSINLSDPGKLHID